MTFIGAYGILLLSRGKRTKPNLQGVTTAEKIKNFFKKPLDKSQNMWYNINVNKGRKTDKTKEGNELMKYTVAVNEKKRTVTVELDGYKGVARCCPTDHFDLTVGVELALERAKVAKREAEAPKVNTMSVTELVKALEKALPKGQMVIVGNGDKMTEAHKQWLRSIIGDCTCSCHCDDDDEVDEEAIYDEGYDDGYADGYAEAKAEYEDYDDDDEDCEVEEVTEEMAVALAKAIVKALGI